MSSPPGRAKVTPADISVIVPVGGAAPAWGRSAASLGHLDPAPGELIVVLDGPHESAEARAAAIGASTLTLPQRSGPAVARNRGAQKATGDFLFFLDSDIEVPPDLLAQLAAWLTEHPDSDAVIGSYDETPGDPGFFSQYRNLLHHYVHQHGHERASTFWSGCGAVRRELFMAADGFDEAYSRPSIEDIELGGRLIGSGHEIRLAKDLQVKHLKRWRLGDMLATDLWRRAVPWTRLMLTQGQLVNDLNVKTRDRWSVALALLPLPALAAGLLWPPALWGALAAALLWLAASAGFPGFLLRRRGAWFAARAVPVYWLYFVLCGLGFGIGLVSRPPRSPSS